MLDFKTQPGVQEQCWKARGIVLSSGTVLKS